MGLEQKLDVVERQVFDRSRFLYGTDAGREFLKDTYGTTQVYFCSKCGFNACMHDMAMLDDLNSPFSFGYDLGDGYQVHMHGVHPDAISLGTLKHKETTLEQFNGYQSSLLDELLKPNFHRFEPRKR